MQQDMRNWLQDNNHNMAETQDFVDVYHMEQIQNLFLRKICFLKIKYASSISKKKKPMKF